VRVVESHCQTRDSGAFDIPAVRFEVLLQHSLKDPALYGLHAIVQIRDGTTDKDRHGVGKVVFFDLACQVGASEFFCHVGIIQQKTGCKPVRRSRATDVSVVKGSQLPRRVTVNASSGVTAAKVIVPVRVQLRPPLDDVGGDPDGLACLEIGGHGV
jgi:hypothetical protein